MGKKNVSQTPGRTGDNCPSASPLEAGAVGGSVPPPANSEPRKDYDVGNWPRVLVITSPESQKVPMKEYAIRKAITGLTTEPKDLYQAKAGHYVVKVETDAASEVLLQTTVMANHPVKVTPHKTLNTSRVITSRILDGASDADLLADLKNQGVSAAKRILKNKTTETKSIILTFTSSTPREKVRLVNVSLMVNPYVAPPMRCFKCLKFGHTRTRCRKNNSICSKCSGEHGAGECSSKDLLCSNCSGAHNSFDRNCPKYLEVKNILNIAAKKHISYKEAKKEHQHQNGATYAKVLQKQTAKDKKPNDQNKTNFVPDRLQTLQFTVIEQDKQHKQEIADIKGHIQKLERDHKTELKQRDIMIMNQEQQMQQQEIQIEQQE